MFAAIQNPNFNRNSTQIRSRAGGMKGILPPPHAKSAGATHKKLPSASITPHCSSVAA